MLHNYLLTAWRNLLKNKATSLLNIGGLSVGMAVATLIGLWVLDELSFDKSHHNYDHIARVIQNVTSSGERKTWKTVPYPLGEELRQRYGSDFKAVVMGSRQEDHLLSYEDKNLIQTGAFFEPQITDLLSLKMIEGSKDALKDSLSVLLSRSVANAFFGKTDPINKPMKLDNTQIVKVAGVYEDIPYNSTFRDVGYMGSWGMYARIFGFAGIQNPWRPNAFVAYVQLADNADPGKISEKIKDVRLNKVMGTPLSRQNPKLFLEPMRQWHLFAEYKNGVNTGGAIQYVWLFATIGIFVLLLACINFMNLSTARSEQRAKEVGIRKAIGSLRGQLVRQFFCESLMIAALAFVVAFALVVVSLPFFNELANKQMSIPWGNPVFWVSAVGFVLLTGLIAGSYPAMYLSSFRPVKVLKGTFKAGRLASVPRKVLVVLQFTVSVILIIGTVIVLRQVQFAKDRPIGYSRDGLVSIPLVDSNLHNHIEALRSDLLRTGAIVELSEAGSATTSSSGSSSGFDWPGKDPGTAVDFQVGYITPAYGKTVGWNFRQGRNFSTEFLTDSNAFILNESAVNFMGLTDPVHQTIRLDGKPYRVIGVVGDMVTESPYEPIRPTVYTLFSGSGNVLILKINPGMSAREALDKIARAIKPYNPSQPFKFQFADAEYAKKFGDEERIGRLAGAFAGLAIFISCLGLFGMASFMAEQRRKEIGVRKVLGASVWGLWALLSRDFIRLVLFSLLIAMPVAYYIMFKWLQHYPYHSEMAWWIFLVAGVGAIMITLLTVSYQSLKGALTNPVQSLRND